MGGPGIGYLEYMNTQGVRGLTMYSPELSLQCKQARHTLAFVHWLTGRGSMEVQDRY